MLNTELKWYSFTSLSNLDLYNLLQLRVSVFVVEQNCAYPEIDGLDPDALHLIARNNSEIVGCLRLIYDESKKQIRLGRIVVAAKYRSKKLGELLIKSGIAKAQELNGTSRIVISAQSQLQQYYEQFGFKPISSLYLEDGIQHLDMAIE